MSDPGEVSSSYRADIDGLRAIAILVVVAFHAGIPGFSGGFVGVDVFFVISGFLITRLLTRELQRTGTISFREFYARRVRRLLPALWLVVGVTIAVDILFLPGLGDTRKWGASIRWAMLGLANVFFKRNTGGYFDGATDDMPLLHFWSLGVEEQFYLFWPLLLFACSRFFFRKHQKWNESRRILAVLLVLVSASFVGAQFMIQKGKVPAAFFLMPYRAWELGMGAVLVFGGGKIRTTWDRVLASCAAFSGLALIGVSVAIYSPSTVFPGFAALLPVLGTVLFIWAGTVSHEGWVHSILSSRPLVRMGLLSYGWYLWHWPLLVMGRLWNLGQELGLPNRLALLSLSLVLAELSLRWVENPIRRAVHLRKIRPLPMIVIGIAVSLVLVLVTLGVGPAEDKILSRRLGSGLVRQIREKATLDGSCFSKADVGAVPCTLALSDAAKKGVVPLIAVWGDSHSCSYFPMLESYGRGKDLRITQYCQGQTPPLLNGPHPILREANSPNDFPDFGDAVIWDLSKKVKGAAPRPVSVVLAARWVYYTGKKTIAGDAPPFSDNAKTEQVRLVEMENRLRDTLTQLHRIGVFRILVMLPYPEFKYFTLRCLQRSRESCWVSRQEIEAYRKDAVTMIHAAMASFSNVRAIDPVTLVCDQDFCPQVLNGMPVVIDTNHPSIAAVQMIGRKHEADLDWLVQAR